jgi:hypothetical protein
MKSAYYLSLIMIVTGLMLCGCLESNPQPTPGANNTLADAGWKRPPSAEVSEQAADAGHGGFDELVGDVGLLDTLSPLDAEVTVPSDMIADTDDLMEIEVEVFNPECNESTPCQDGFLCEPPGQCVCDCNPQCEDKQCGPDQCLGSCGECPEGKVCAGGTCCTPSCYGKECGPDGCGGSCGECGEYDTCLPTWICQPCAPACAGKACGPDGCGGICGECAEGLFCQYNGTCSECELQCEGKDCGPDGCGGICGECANDCTGKPFCMNGKCVDDCVPDCAGKTCGGDGCGCTCGECSLHQVCLMSVCVPAPKGPCLQVHDCLQYLPEDFWPADWVPVCKPGTCWCGAKKL